MKKSFALTLFMFATVCGYAQTIYKTKNTSNLYTGQWTQIASVTINQRFHNSNALLELMGGYSSSYVAVCKVFFRVKQQAEFPGQPYVQLEMVERNNLRIAKEDLVAVITTMDGSGNTGTSTVDLFLRVNNNYEVIAFQAAMLNEIVPSFFSNQLFNTDLPAGMQVPCKYTHQFATQGYFEEKVGIGTQAVTEALEVNGTIRAKEVKVEAAPWPDYVFSHQYTLPSLEQTALYIENNGHLPGIPTAEQVAANGIKVGEMNAKLLEKIEELTRYLIEQNNQIKELRQKVEALESR